jgi:flagellar hook-basal body complex protein FliE
MRIEPRVNVFERVPAGPPPTPPAPVELAREGSRSPFLSRLSEAIRDVNQTQVDAGVQAQRLATGEADNIQDVVLGLEKADLALQLTVQVAQRAIDAYREISRMQV